MSCTAQTVSELLLALHLAGLTALLAVALHLEKALPGPASAPSSSSSSAGMLAPLRRTLFLLAWVIAGLLAEALLSQWVVRARMEGAGSGSVRAVLMVHATLLRGQAVQRAPPPLRNRGLPRAPAAPRLQPPRRHGPRQLRLHPPPRRWPHPALDQRHHRRARARVGARRHRSQHPAQCSAARRPLPLRHPMIAERASLSRARSRCERWRSWRESAAPGLLLVYSSPVSSSPMVLALPPRSPTASSGVLPRLASGGCEDSV
eukprot:1510013-Rhodomonas_salina.1